MEIGVFIPIGNNGWLVSTTSPQYKPSFELNKQMTLNAERYGLDFALSMIKLRGFGGKSEFWDHNLESFTLMAGLAAVTSRIKLFATLPTLAMPPAIAARMASTIDSISNGRFGLNLITGWQRPEYSQMGLWPGDEYFAPPLRLSPPNTSRCCATCGRPASRDLKGEFFTDGRLPPEPAAAGRHEDHLRRPERRRHGLHRQVRRLQLLLRQGLQHADGLRRHGRAHAGDRAPADRPQRRDLRACSW